MSDDKLGLRSWMEIMLGCVDLVMFEWISIMVKRK